MSKHLSTIVYFSAFGTTVYLAGGFGEGGDESIAWCMHGTVFYHLRLHVYLYVL